VLLEKLELLLKLEKVTRTILEASELFLLCFD